MNRFVLFFVTACGLFACKEDGNKFSDPDLVKIADFQDRRQSDSLYRYFNDNNPTHRQAAVLAFASIQDENSVDRLQNVLRYDKSSDVRKSAAIALGQIPIQRSAAILWRTLTEEKDPIVLREVIEACGKTFSRENVSKLDADDSTPALAEGLAWAYYRFGMRGFGDSTLIMKAVKYLSREYSINTRLGAASFFARAPLQVNSVEEDLVLCALNDESPWVRAAATTALKKINSKKIARTLGRILVDDEDYRVRIAASRALSDFAFDTVKVSLYKGLEDKDINVKIAVAEVIRNIGTSFEATTIEAMAKRESHWRVKALLYETVLIVLNDKRVADVVVNLYQNEQNPYAKAAYLTALGQTTHAWRFIDNELHRTTVPLIKSSAAAALVSVNANSQFSDSLKIPFLRAYERAIATGDPAVVGAVAGGLMDLRFNYIEMVKDISFLYDAKKGLSLPKDNEALQPLEAAIAYFEGNEAPKPVKNEFNHPIDWDLVKTIPKNQQALIKTEKGDIILRLLVEEAPGSVANFVQLINSNYFNGKNFHRVVPNFVIQGGCNRGDGWGSEAYSIRSEFSERHYTEGSVGMASAGKDTEGTQWFITHAPTPHLDGRYTIFAVTESGMDVVNRIEVGDKIISVSLVP